MSGEHNFNPDGSILEDAAAAAHSWDVMGGREPQAARCDLPVRWTPGASQPDGSPSLSRAPSGRCSVVACAASYALEHLGGPTLRIDRGGAVSPMNSGASALLGADLKLVGGRLRAAHRESDRALHRLIAALRRPDTSRGHRATAAVRILRVGKRPLVIEAVGMGGPGADELPSFAAILHIVDLEVRPAPAEDTLRAAFELTAAEARLAVRLAGGGSLQEAAEALGIAKNTARSQLKAVFGKTGTSRQADLVALLARLGR